MSRTRLPENCTAAGITGGQRHGTSVLSGLCLFGSNAYGAGSGQQLRLKGRATKRRVALYRRRRRFSRRTESPRRISFDSKLTVEGLARRARMSKRSFQRHFQAETQMSPIRYLQRLRILHACRLLRTTERTVQQITDDCGTGDVAHFCRLFRRLTGATPGEFRRGHESDATRE